MDSRDKLKAMIVAKEHYLNILSDTGLMLRFAELTNTQDLLTATLICLHQINRLDMKIRELEKTIREGMSVKA